MSSKFQIIKPNEKSLVKIKIVGVGGGGGNAINHMMDTRMGEVEFIAVNTDAQVLDASKAEVKLHIGNKLTNGLGAGGRPEIGLKAAEESRGDIQSALEGSNMVFITAGMGGGTGTGAAPIVAQISKDLGILTVGVVTKPFKFEGAHRMDQAELGITSLRQYVDALMVIPNEQLKALRKDSTDPITFKNAFSAADDVLQQGVQSICDLIQQNGFINLDFNDVSTVMKDAGTTHMGVSEASGKDMAKTVVEQACHSPLLQTSVVGAKRVLVNLVIGEDTVLDDVDDVMSKISEQAAASANIIFGQTFDSDYKDKMKVTIIATCFEDENEFELPADTFNKMQEKKEARNQAVAAAVNSEPASPPPQPVQEEPPKETELKGFFGENYVHEDYLDNGILDLFRDRKGK